MALSYLFWVVTFCIVTCTTGKGLEVQFDFPPYGEVQEIINGRLQPSHYQGQSTGGKPPGHYRGVLNHYVQTGIIQSFNYHDKEQYDNTNMQMYYQCSVSVTLRNDPRPVVVGSSQTAFPQKQRAREEAARNAVQYLHTHLQPGPGMQ